MSNEPNIRLSAMKQDIQHTKIEFTQFSIALGGSMEKKFQTLIAS